MLFSQASLLLALSTVVAAAPYEKRWFGSWGQESGSSVFDSFLEFGKRHSWRGRTTYQGQCNVAAVQMPQAPKPLPPPSEGLTLYHVAVGRGTQNYTCDTSNATAVPVAAGAVASLFNVTCMSADSPTLLSVIPNVALELPTPTANDATSPIYRDISGHHYFTDLTTAFFNLDTNLNTYGAGGFKKVNASDAPATAVKGQHGQGYGAVPWLKLQAKTKDECVFQEVYRINTAGGNPPTSCQGQAAEFEIQYSAEYWFYS
ncbi:hypothetical protein PRZ48_003774 [Zasmidium cellare]|uniref:Malate dehydrogenase n=1 Tax=Zasmidium cellare TaxID=395010 RepID=A0ABR0EW15_ZASCE|nr:hypothetical protein PRZ48_003774 [Zasmidium cellare]